MYKRLQKNLTSDELLPSLWDECKVNVTSFIAFIYEIGICGILGSFIAGYVPLHLNICGGHVLASSQLEITQNVMERGCLQTVGDSCLFWQKEFLDKYEGFVQLVAKIYPNESILSVSEMKGYLTSM